MLHKMSLYEEYFDLMESGHKTIEIRLNDEKRRRIQIGDTIEFTKLPDQDETLQVDVIKLKHYQTFNELYEDLPYSKMGCAGWTLQELVDGTYEIYTPEQEKQYGVLAIEVRVT
ncbi:ASCH domain-containing protein [Pseudalkalibacillus sp. Hm43]|uniref:ASCH domain-containing protein n=1 Tax=Pseudalkalibacillus sp. Hm43 TaxID=3450742 RepID=UPI003F43DD4B